jgi:2-polyprenyl-6-methoxyphenol hydroxylase-like FAD-dependent oxidoreductase
MAAAALARHFEQVTLLERDPLPTTPETRKGVPQARHVHVLLKQGERILADLFPGLVDELLAGGATAIDMARDTRWFYFGAWKARFPSGIEFLSQSRSFLEWQVRRRLASIPGVTLRGATDVRGLVLDDGRRVRGVRLDDGASLAADLVVDATGRVSRGTAWLAEAGLPTPRESQVKVAVGYASRLYRRPPGALADWKALFVYPRPPGTRLGVMVPVEGDRWMVTLVGWFGDHPGDDDASFLDFARSLPVPDFDSAIREAEPLSPIVLHKFPANLRRHYEDLATMPDGLAVIGDALCSFNPIYGQGMTTGAIGAQTLDAALAEHRQRHGDGELVGFSPAFQRRLAARIDSPWLLTTCEDLRSDAADGERPAWMPLLHWYTRRVQQLTWHDEFVGKRFLEVMHLTKSPSALFHPYIVWRALTAGAPDTARKAA